MDVQEQNRQRPEPQQDELENEYLSSLDRLLAGLSPEKWKLWQTIAGAVLGIAGGLCLFYLGGTETFGSVGLVLAVVILLLIPNSGSGTLPEALPGPGWCPSSPSRQCFWCICFCFPWDKANKKVAGGHFFVCLPGCGSRPSPGGRRRFAGAFGPRKTKARAGPFRVPPLLCARFARPPPPRGKAGSRSLRQQKRLRAADIHRTLGLAMPGFLGDLHAQ